MSPETPPTGPAEDRIGAVLRAARAMRGLSLAEMRVRTKIDARYLAALEADRFGDLPPLPFARGFLRTYAVELGLDPEPLVERLAAAVFRPGPAAGGELHRLDSALTPARTMTPLRRAAITVGAVGFVTAAVLGIFFLQQVREFNREVQPDPAGTPQAGARPVGAPPAATGEAPAPASAPTTAAAGTPDPPTRPEGTRRAPHPQAGTRYPAGAPAAQAPEETVGITVDVQAVGRSWIRVQGGGGQIYEGILTAGETRRWQSTGPMTIRAGNAAAVVVTVNGRAVGTLGRRGEVVSRTFSKDVTP